MRRLVTGLCMVALAGCGGDDGGGGGDAPSEAQFRADGKRICDTGADRVRRVTEAELAKVEVARLEPAKRQVQLLKASRKEVEKTMSEIEALDAPEAAQPHVERLTSGVREVMDILTSGKQIGSSEVTRLTELTGQTRRAAEAAGLQACLPENAG